MIARLSWWLYVLALVGIVSGVLLLAGCASQAQFVGWCVVPQAGQSDSGHLALRVVCQADK